MSATRAFLEIDVSAMPSLIHLPTTHHSVQSRLARYLVCPAARPTRSAATSSPACAPPTWPTTSSLLAMPVTSRSNLGRPCGRVAGNGRWIQLLLDLAWSLGIRA